MTDARISRLADLIVDYSLELQPGQVFRIDALDAASPLALAFYRSAIRAGAFPYFSVGLEGTLELLLEHGTKEQIEYIAPQQWEEIEELDAIATIWSEANTRALSRVDPARHANYLAAQRRLHNRRWERIAAGRDAVVRDALPDERSCAGRGHVALELRGLRLFGVPRGHR